MRHAFWGLETLHYPKLVSRSSLQPRSRIPGLGGRSDASSPRRQRCEAFFATNPWRAPTDWSCLNFMARPKWTSSLSSQGSSRGTVMATYRDYEATGFQGVCLTSAHPLVLVFVIRLGWTLRSSIVNGVLRCTTRPGSPSSRTPSTIRSISEPPERRLVRSPKSQ